MKCRRIIFPEINKAELVIQELPRLGEHEVRVRTAYSTISPGTERAKITGNPNISGSGAPSLVFPRSSGYSSSGTVIETGSEVENVKLGDQVIVYWGQSCEHQSD